jgi:hypothetical protein
MAKTKKIRFSTKRRINRQKKQTRQRGGALKEDALKVLADNKITDLDNFLFGSGKFVLNKEGTSYNDVIYGEYTFRKTRDMSRTYHLIAFTTSSPDKQVTLLSVNDY